MDVPKVLIAGVGNELRQDDAFGIEFVRHWNKISNIPENIKTMEVGIGGIHLVQELYSRYDMLVMIDAVDWDGSPGQVYLQKLDSVSDLTKMAVADKRAFLADMHYTNPMRALMLAKALQVLPRQVFMLGCQAAKCDFDIGMSEEVNLALPEAINRLKILLNI